MIEIHGPFPESYVVTIDGFKVPFLAVIPVDDDRVEVVLDQRFGLDSSVDRDEFNRWAPLLANAMAIAAGYSCHGENCMPTNAFTVRLGCISLTPPKPELTLVPKP